jgi:DNA end-binding protein Ku
MAIRAMWKGVIRCGEMRLPVKLYSAVQDRSVRFHLLHDQDMVRVKRRLVNPETKQTVPYERTQRGFEVQRGRFVLLRPHELSQLESSGDDRDIEISRFVPASAISHQWYDRPYFLGPDGADAGQRYAALAGALEQQQCHGIAHWTMRKNEYSGALRGENGVLMLLTLRHANEIVPSSELDAPAGRDLTAKERQLAEQLVEALTDDFEPTAFQDDYRERVWELIETKRRGGKVKLKKRVAVKTETKSLAASLQASLQKAR